MILLVAACSFISDVEVNAKFATITGDPSDSSDTGFPPNESLSDAEATLNGSGQESAGGSVSGAGDVNGDGFDDMLIGAHFYGGANQAVGAAYLILGSADPASRPLAEADGTYLGDVGSEVGGSVAGAGDVNGDGYADMIIGARGASTAYLVLGSGSVSEHAFGPDDLQYVGAAGGSAGTAVASAGDVNDDGYGDLLVTSPGAAGQGESSTVAAYLLLGSDEPASSTLATSGVELDGLASPNTAAYAAAGVGDVNGDGADDFLVGEYRYDTGEGAASLFLGSAAPVSEPLSAADAGFSGVDNDCAGYSLAGAGDFDGDGYADLVVGAFRDESSNGAAYVVLGSTAPRSGALVDASAKLSGADVEEAGFSVAGAGDLDGDGFADIIIGAPLNGIAGLNSGAMYVVRGTSTPQSGALLDAGQMFLGEAAGAAAGVAVSGAGDVDADGFDDVLVGAYLMSGGDGAAYLLLGNMP